MERKIIDLPMESALRSANKTLGIVVLDDNPDSLELGLQCTEDHHQPAGFVHGGIYILMAESAASIAAALYVDIRKFNIFGMQISANHMRPHRKGFVTAKALPVHRGKTSHVYDVKIVNEENKVLSIVRCTIAVRARD